MIHFWQLGASSLAKMGKKFGNKFWGQILISLQSFMNGAIKCNPEHLSISPIWDNPFITRNNKPLKQTEFPIITEKVKVVADFFNPINGNMLKKEDFQAKFNLQISSEDFLELSFIIKSAFAKLGLRNNLKIFQEQPTRPLLINAVSSAIKGCKAYYLILSKENQQKVALVDRETKWHTELHKVFGKDFWDNSYKMNSKIKYENRLKWLQYQITRNCLFTNSRVNKFMPHISPLCTYCSHENNFKETISHLFYQCHYSKKLLGEIEIWLGTFNVQFTANEESILFGNHAEPIFSVVNTITLWTKQFIWSSKFSHKDLSLGLVQRFFQQKLTDLKNIYDYCENQNLFNQWTSIYDYLLRL